jgi:hypothetical protein
MVMAKQNQNAGQDFDPCPEGMHPGVCVDVVDLGICETGFRNKDGTPEKKPMVAFSFEVHATDENDKPVMRNDGKLFLISQRFNNTLGGGSKESKLLKFLESWTGRRIPDEVRAAGFDLDKMLGRNAQLVIAHRTSKDGQKTFANIITITPAAKGAPKLEASKDHVRVKDRPGYEPPVGSEEWEKRNPQLANNGKGAAPSEEEDEDGEPPLPF